MSFQLYKASCVGDSHGFPYAMFDSWSTGGYLLYFIIIYILYINTVVSHVFMVFKIRSEAIKVGFPEDRLHRK